MELLDFVGAHFFFQMRISSLALACVPLAHAMLPIHIRNFRFIQPSSPKNEVEDNEIFFVKGVDYQPGGSSGFDPDGDSDALSDPDVCARDAYNFQALGINTVRIYSLNPDLNHDKCVTIYNNAGIYLLLDVNSGHYGENLNRADPWGTYNSQYLTRVFKFIEAFKDYPNVLGFFSGNEVINDEENYASIDPPYIRAVQRDMKQYIAKHSNRTIPVGYSAASNDGLVEATFKYLQCNSFDGKNVSKSLDDSRSDFFGFNTYSWCSGTSDWKTSGYDKLNETYSDTVIPLIFSEYGCNKNLPRTFDEVSEGLYGGLKYTFSGGLVYEYIEEVNNYGLVEMDSDGDISYKKDYDNLKSQYKNVTLPETKESSLPKNSVYKCDSKAITNAYKDFGVNNFTIPDQPEEIIRLIKYGVNSSNIGKILDDYDAPTTFNYTIKDSDGKEISASIAYPSGNKVNELSTTSSATSVRSTSTKSSQTVSKTTSSTHSLSSSHTKMKKNAAESLTISSFKNCYMALILSLLTTFF